jgi:hypothetical protein
MFQHTTLGTGRNMKNQRQALITTIKKIDRQKDKANLHAGTLRGCSTQKAFANAVKTWYM